MIGVKNNGLYWHRYYSIMDFPILLYYHASIDFGAGFLTLHTKLTGEKKRLIIL